MLLLKAACRSFERPHAWVSIFKFSWQLLHSPEHAGSKFLLKHVITSNDLAPAMWCQVMASESNVNKRNWQAGDSQVRYSETHMLWQTFPLLLVAQKNFIHKQFYVLYKVPTSEKIKGLLYCLEWRCGSIDNLCPTFLKLFSRNLSFYLLPPVLDLLLRIRTIPIESSSQNV